MIFNGNQNQNSMSTELTFDSFFAGSTMSNHQHQKVARSLIRSQIYSIRLRTVHSAKRQFVRHLVPKAAAPLQPPATKI